MKGQPFFNRWRLAFLGVLLVSIFLYLPSLKGLKIWDDIGLLDGSAVGGHTVRGALTEPFMGAYFRPLVSLSFVLENRLWNGNPFFYHQTNILLHAAATAALIGLLLFAFESRRIAILGGLLFAAQPAQVSTVAWIGGRTDSMCSLFVILFGLFLVLAVRSEGHSRAAWSVASALMFFAAVTTKEQTLALVPLVPLAYVAFARPGEQRSRLKHAGLLAPYIAASVVFLALWLALYPNPFEPLLRGPIEQLQTAGHASTYYLLLLLFPSGRWMHTLSLGALEAIGWASVALGLAALGWFVWLTLRTVRIDPKLGWFVGLAALAILPVSNLVPLPSLFVAPYRAGVAGIGVAAALAVWLVRARLPMKPVLTGLYLCWCGWLVFWGAGRWADPVTLFGTVAESDPTSIIARRNLSSELLKSGGDPEQNARKAIGYMEGILTTLYGSEAWRDPDEAIRLFRTDHGLAYRVQTNQGNYVRPEAWLGELFGQLGYAHAKAMEFELSRSAFDTAVGISPENFGANVALAEFAIHEGDYRVAARHLRVAVAARPGDGNVRSLLASCYEHQKLDRLAMSEYGAAIKAQPWFAPTYLLLADLQAKNGQKESAIETLRLASQCEVQETDGVRQRLIALGRPDLAASLTERPSSSHEHGHDHAM